MKCVQMASVNFSLTGVNKKIIKKNKGKKQKYMLQVH